MGFGAAYGAGRAYDLGFGVLFEDLFCGVSVGLGLVLGITISCLFMWMDTRGRCFRR